MTDKAIHAQCVECRLVLIEAHSMQILTTASDASPVLPRESIPAYTRLAATLTEAIKQKYGLHTIQLAVLPDVGGNSYYAIHEIISPQEAAPRELSFHALDELAASEFTSEQRALVLKIMRGEASELGRFARLGWINELLAKIEGDQDRSRWPVVQQLNQGIDFCLLSMTDANGDKMWFKAVGEPNTREYALTVKLTRRFPAYLPKIVATIPEWNGWITEHVVGTPLHESAEIHHSEQALTALAAMQKEAASSIASLLPLGAKDWSCSRLLLLSAPFFEEARQAMRTQTSTLSEPLTDMELDHLRMDIESGLVDFMSTGIPETLLHGDVGHGNTIASPAGPVFLDWAETYVGHPFLSAEHLLADLARSNRAFSENQAALRTGYSAHWKTYAPPRELKRLVALAPAIAAFFYGVLCWDANRKRPDPTRAWPLLRSMLRRSKHELEQMSGVTA
jgi:hypothetical protein